MSMRRKLLGGAALLMAAFSLTEANATSCAVPPTCAQLGYTMKKADCGDMPIMRCPFALDDDNQVYCQKSVKLTALPILYGDGSVSKTLLSGPTAPKPIGFVFDETNHLAMALTDVKKDGSAGTEAMMWSDEQIDTPLENCSDDTIYTCGTDGRKNTDILLKITTGNYEAAKAVNKYEPAGCASPICQKGKWFLPSMKELKDIKNQGSSIGMTSMFLNVLGIQSVWHGESWAGSSSYWSSNEASAQKSHAYQMANAYSVTNNKDKLYYVVRPVVKY